MSSMAGRISMGAARGGVGVAVQIFEQKLEGNWEQPADESNRK
jgi:hypothetical protein